MEAIKKIQLRVKNEYPETKVLTPLKIAEKRTIIYELDRHLKKMTSKESHSITPNITEICLSLLQSEGGHSLQYYIAMLFGTNRLDSQQLVTQLVQISHQPQLSETIRNKNITMIGQVFAHVNTLIQPPAKEIIEILIKLQNKRPPEFKALSFDTIEKVLLSGHALNHSDTLLKTILKLNNGEFLPGWLQCVTAIVAEYPSTYVNWHNVWSELMQVAIKEMETRCTYQVMAALMCARLKESKQQNNIKSSFKQFNPTLKGDGKKKSTVNVLDVPRSLQDMVLFLAAMVQKLQAGDVTQAQQNIVKSIGQLLSQLFKQSPEHLECVPVEHLFGCLLLIIPEQPLNQQITRIFVDVIDTLESCDSYIDEVFNFIVQALKQKTVIFKNETLQDVQIYTQKVQKSELSIGKGAQISLLRTLNELIAKFDHDKLATLTSSCNTFVDIILPYFQTHDTAIFACEVIQNTGKRNPSWLHQLTSVMLSQVQIQSADMMAQAPAIIYNAGAKQQSSQQTCLSMLSLALSCLLQLFPRVIGGEPISLVSIAFKTARGFIQGNHEYRDISEFNKKTLNNRMHGFIIIEGLIGLGERWVNQNIEELMQLLSQTFNKQICQVDFARLSEEVQYLESYVQEFKTKAQALSCILKLFQNQHLTKPIVKRLGSFLGNATMYLTYKDSKLLWSATSWQEVTLVHSKLFACLGKEPSIYYKSKLVNLLHTICDTIINENVDVFFLEADDDYLTQTTKPNLLNEVTSIQGQANLLVRTQSLFRQPFDIYVEKQKLVENAINLFVQIYGSQNITLTNQDQLIKHFLAHTQPSVKKGQKDQIVQYRPEKLLKMKRISVTFIQILKTNQGIIPQQQVNQLVDNLLMTQDDGFARVCGELQFENNTQQIVDNGPDTTLDKIEESLSQNLQENKTVQLAMAASLCGLIVRNFDEQIWTPSIARVTNIFLKLLQSSNLVVAKFAIHFASEIAKQSTSFGQQVLSSIYTKYYSGKIQENIEPIRKSIVWYKQDQDIPAKEILLNDTIQHRDTQSAFIENGQYDFFTSDLVLGETELVNQVISAGQMRKLDADGKLIYKILDKVAECQFENSTLIQLSQENYISVAKAHLKEHGLKTHLEFVKQCLAYTHLSSLALMSYPSQKNDFKRAFRSETLSFVVESLIESLSDQLLGTADLVQLLNFGMLVSSNVSKRMKLAGIELVKVVVKLLAQTVEQVGDVDEDLTPRARKMQIYLASPLLLEQFEAQIFSIIRQVLTSKGVDQQPSLIKSVLDLVYDFICLPITKDASLIKRIVDMLIIDLKQPFNGEIFTHEGLITEMHFQKLGCLAKLYMASKGHLQKYGDLPSKYEKEERDNLSRVFQSGQVLDLVQKQLLTAIQDLVNIQSGYDLASFKKNEFIVGGSFNILQLKQNATYLISALIMSGQSEKIIIIVHSYVIGCLQAEFSGELFDFYQSKVTALSQLLTYVDRINPAQLSELLPLMQELASLGVSEITQLVVQIQGTIAQSQKLEAPKILNQVVAVLISADSDFQDKTQIMYRQTQTNDRDVISTCLECMEKCINEMVSEKMEMKGQLNSFATKTFSKLYIQVSTSSQNKNQDLYFVAFMKLLQRLSETDITYLYVEAVTDLKFILKESSLVTPQSQLLFLNLLNLTKGPEVLNLVSDMQEQTFELLMSTLLKTQLNTELTKIILLKTITMCHSKISVSRLGLPQIAQIYTKLESTHHRAAILVPYFALLLQVMQSKQQVDDVTRNLAAEHLAMLVRVDLSAFQQFAMSKDAKGQLMLSGVEKTVTENVIRQYAATQKTK